MSSNLTWLGTFFQSHQDESGEWGCTIENTDDGWRFEFELATSRYEILRDLNVGRGTNPIGQGPDYVMLWNDGSKVRGLCGPLELDNLIAGFRHWIEASKTP